MFWKRQHLCRVLQCGLRAYEDLRGVMEEGIAQANAWRRVGVPRVNGVLFSLVRRETKMMAMRQSGFSRETEPVGYTYIYIYGLL